MLDGIPGRPTLLRHCRGAVEPRAVRLRPSALRLVGERSVVGRRQTVRTAGRSGSENAGMSSEKESENLSRRKPKVS